IRRDVLVRSRLSAVFLVLALSALLGLALLALALRLFPLTFDYGHLGSCHSPPPMGPRKKRTGLLLPFYSQSGLFARSIRQSRRSRPADPSGPGPRRTRPRLPQEASGSRHPEWPRSGRT